MSKVKIIPELRFPEFEKDGEWQEKTLNEITPLIFDGTHQTPKYTENGIPFFSVENLISGKKNKFISKEDYIIATNKNKPEKFDILITRIGNIGFPKVIDWDYEFSIYVTLAVIKKSKEFNSYYLHSFIQSDFYQKEIKSKSLLNATPCKINMDELRKTKILLPPDKEHKEQQKIASCLSTLDEIIATHSQKLNLLKDHKKGMMQNLFPQEGEKVPKYRFKEFENDGEWVEKKLGDMSEIGRGKSKHRPRDESSLFGGIYPFIQTGDIRKANLYLTNYTQTYSEKGLKQSKLWDENTLCITIAANIAETAILKIKACFPDSVIGIIPKKGITDVLFINYLIENFKQQIQSFSQGMAQDNLNQEKLSNLIFLFPLIQEQQKIASCLSSLDALITAQAEKIEQLKLHKKGLMQGLFPKIEI